MPLSRSEQGGQLGGSDAAGITLEHQVEDGAKKLHGSQPLRFATLLRLRDPKHLPKMPPAAQAAVDGPGLQSPVSDEATDTSL